MDFIKDEESKLVYQKYSDRISKLYYSQIDNSDFMTPNHIELLKSICNREKIYYKIYKSHEYGERQIIFYSLDDFNLEENLNQKIEILNIDKLNSSVGHRDILGAVLNLGIDRNKIGDISLKESSAMLVCKKEIADFILFNLKSVKRNKVKVSSTPKLYLENKDFEFESINTIVSSLRLDAILSAVLNSARSKTKTIIEKDFVKLNYIISNNPSTEVKSQDMVSVRGFGRFILKEIEGKTRKDKFRIRVEKFI